MTATAVRSQTSTRRSPLKAAVAVLAPVCLVLFLLAIEQRQVVAAWRYVSTEVVPATGRVFGWMGDVVSGKTEGFSGLGPAIDGGAAARAASPTDAVLMGAFAPADDATRSATGSVTFAGATLVLERGETLQTVPARIAAGRERFSSLGETFAERLGARSDAQIELRKVVPIKGARAVAASPLCGGAVPGTVALLHRRDRVDVLLFHDRVQVGPDASPQALCGVWHYRKS